MHVGLFFGSFNPIHIGHLIIANYLLEHSDLSQIWLVVTPHNPHKKKESLLDDYQRLHMVNLAIEDYLNIKSSTIEFGLPQPNYTVNTLAHLTEKFPNNQFSIIMGEDNLNTLHKWKNYNYILEYHQIYVYPRIHTVEVNNQFLNHPKVQFSKAPIIEISSTFIRSEIKSNKNVRPLLPQKVWEYIDHNLFYK